MELTALTYTETPFGDRLHLNIPEDCDLIIVCIDEGPGRKPLTIYLPHQVYRKTLQKLLEEYPYARGVTIIPVNSENQITIGKNVINRNLNGEV